MLTLCCIAGSGSGPDCCCSCCFSSTQAGSESACSCGSSGNFLYETSSCEMPSTVTGIEAPTTLAAVETTAAQSTAQPAASTSSTTTTSTSTSTTTTTTTTTSTTSTTTTTTTTTPSPSTETGSTAEPPLELVDEQWLTEQLARMPLDDRVALGFNFTELVLDCRFAGSECTSECVTDYSPFCVCLALCLSQTISSSVLCKESLKCAHSHTDNQVFL